MIQVSPLGPVWVDNTSLQEYLWVIHSREQFLTAKSKGVRPLPSLIIVFIRLFGLASLTIASFQSSSVAYL
jgi:hypothetical protein